MSNPLSERWAKFDVVARTFSGILLPLIVMLVGHWYTSEQQRANAARLQQDKDAEVEQRKVDRVGNIIKHLASDSPRERLLGITFINYLNEHKEAPPELGPGLIAIVSTETNPVVINAASSSPVISQAVKSDPRLAKNIRQAADANPIVAEALAKNQKLDETLTTLSTVGAEFDKEAAQAAVRSIFKGTNFTGYDNEQINVTVTAQRTAPAVIFTLDGQSQTGTQFSFKLDKAKHNPTILQMSFDFPGEEPGRYLIRINGSRGASLFYQVSGPPLRVVNFRFYIL